MRLKKSKILLISLFLSLGALAQDERYIRELFLKKFDAENSKALKKTYSYIVPTPFYTLDVSGDGKPESFVYAKKENEDWLDIFDSDKKMIYQFKFDAMGFDSRLYKIRFASIDKEVGVALLYYYEGATKYYELESTARIYIMTFKRQTFSDFKVLKGPYLFREYRDQRNQYSERVKDVEIMDLNGDKRNEIVFKHHLYSEVVIVKPDGKFQEYRVTR